MKKNVLEEVLNKQVSEEIVSLHYDCEEVLKTIPVHPIDATPMIGSIINDIDTLVLDTGGGNLPYKDILNLVTNVSKLLNVLIDKELDIKYNL